VTAPDPVAAYTAALGAALHGPRRAKERLLAEIADGLRDAAEPYRATSADLATAVDRATGEFGRPHELVPECQRELTIRQTRVTAARLALCAPLVLAGWHLLWIGAGTGAWRLVAIPLAAVTTLGAVAAAAVLVLTGRLGRAVRTPARLPAVTAWTASVAAVAMLLTTAFLVAVRADAAALNPLLLAAGTAVVGHAVVARAARSCRRCGELDDTGRHTPGT
jgi:hypothetical protein